VTATRATQVLVVADEPMVRAVRARYLHREGFQVAVAADGEDALAQLGAGATDLVLLDLMLPRVDGYEVLRQLRSRSDIPVIMLTARGSETDRVVGLEIGADDYVTKPFSPREVVARVRAVLRRTGGDGREPESGLRRCGDLVVDLARREVSREGRVVALTRKEFDLLAFLCAHPGQTFTRAQLLTDVWDFAWEGDSSTVTVHVRRLREKVEDDPASPRHLVTVWGVGYRFEP